MGLTFFSKGKPEGEKIMNSSSAKGIFLFVNAALNAFLEKNETRTDDVFCNLWNASQEKLYITNISINPSNSESTVDLVCKIEEKLHYFQLITDKVFQIKEISSPSFEQLNSSTQEMISEIYPSASTHKI